MNGEKDFSHLERFPGEIGNTFDILLHRLEVMERMPVWLFWMLLFIPALVGSRANWLDMILLWGFMMGDWLLIRLLRSAKVSFGPARPPAMVLAFLRMPFGWLPSPFNWILELAGTLLVVFGFWIEPHRLGVTRQVLFTPKLPMGTIISLLHLGDLHIERITRRERSLVKEINRLSPDLILFSGDILNLSYLGDEEAQRSAHEIIDSWGARKGTFAVTGSPAVDFPKTVTRILQNTPVRLLKDELVTVVLPGGKINIIGLICTHRPHLDGSRLEKLAPHDRESLNVLLYHTPDLAPAAAKMGIDLQLSGHTHGGQVRIPGFGALFTGSLYGKRFESGKHQVDSMTLYVTRGIGMEGAGAPRVRFFCPPEIIFWEISGTGSLQIGEKNE